MYNLLDNIEILKSQIANGLSLEHNLEFLSGLKQVCDSNIEGDFYDIGCWTGSVSFCAASFFKKMAINKKIYLFDTFLGHPETQTSEVNSKWKFDLNYFKNVDISKIEKSFEKIGFDNYVIVKGKIEDTLPNIKSKPCFVSLDMNHYEPTKFCLDYLSDTGFDGLIFEDDYNHIDGITLAFNESKAKKVGIKTNRGGFFKF